MAAVAGAFSAVTILTMVTVVALGLAGLKTLRLRFAERYVHALAGATLVLSGLAVQLLGL